MKSNTTYFVPVSDLLRETFYFLLLQKENGKKISYYLGFKNYYRIIKL